MSETIEDRKVIAFGTRQPIVVKDEPEEPIEVVLERERQNDIDANLKAIDELRSLVAAGDVTGVCFVGRHLPTGNFIHDLCPDFRHQPEETAGMTALLYAGIFRELMEEMMGIASLRPMLIMGEDGKIEEVPGIVVNGGDGDPEFAE